MSVFKEIKGRKVEKKNKIWKLENVPLVGAGPNDNYYFFPKEELAKSYKTLEGVPVVANLTGEPDDHATMSSLNVVGHVYNVRFEPNEEFEYHGKKYSGVVYGDLEITDPNVGEKVERIDSKGKMEIDGVSIGATADAFCSICGEVANQCEHRIGEEYDGEICYMVAKNVEFDHVAMTSFPAWKLARVKEVAIINARKKMRKVNSMMYYEEPIANVESNKNMYKEGRIALKRGREGARNKVGLMVSPSVNEVVNKVIVTFLGDLGNETLASKEFDKGMTNTPLSDAEKWYLETGKELTINPENLPVIVDVRAMVEGNAWKGVVEKFNDYQDFVAKSEMVFAQLEDSLREQGFFSRIKRISKTYGGDGMYAKSDNATRLLLRRLVRLEELVRRAFIKAQEEGKESEEEGKLPEETDLKEHQKAEEGMIQKIMDELKTLKDEVMSLKDEVKSLKEMEDIEEADEEEKKEEVEAQIEYGTDGSQEDIVEEAEEETAKPPDEIKSEDEPSKTTPKVKDFKDIDESEVQYGEEGSQPDLVEEAEEKTKKSPDEIQTAKKLRAELKKYGIKVKTNDVVELKKMLKVARIAASKEKKEVLKARVSNAIPMYEPVGGSDYASRNEIREAIKANRIAQLFERKIGSKMRR